jgi:hypothetical protein
MVRQAHHAMAQRILLWTVVSQHLKMRDIDKLIDELIPPNNYQRRAHFSNEHIVQDLNDVEKLKVEQRLIEILGYENDVLIGETLVLLKSTNSLQALFRILNRTKKPLLRIIWASFINEIRNGDDEMKKVALEALEKITRQLFFRNSDLISAFYYLARFDDERIKRKIQGYLNHKNYLVASNAKTSLGLDNFANTLLGKMKYF